MSLCICLNLQLQDNTGPPPGFAVWKYTNPAWNASLPPALLLKTFSRHCQPQQVWCNKMEQRANQYFPNERAKRTSPTSKCRDICAVAPQLYLMDQPHPCWQAWLQCRASDHLSSEELDVWTGNFKACRIWNRYQNDTVLLLNPSIIYSLVRSDGSAKRKRKMPLWCSIENITIILKLASNP